MFKWINNNRLHTNFFCLICQAGGTRAVLVYRFMCRNTCLGNLNSRQVLAVFTLESSGDILGRITIQLRICACPGRDRRQDEQAPVDTAQLKEVKCGKTVSDSAAVSKHSKSDDDEQWYTMRVSMGVNSDRYKSLSSHFRQKLLECMIHCGTAEAVLMSGCGHRCV